MREDLPDHFIQAAHAALPILGADAIGQIGYDITQGLPPDAIVAEYRGPESAAAVEPLAEIMEEGVGWDAAGCYLMGLADGYRVPRATAR
jgi:hypothetical protein